MSERTPEEQAGVARRQFAADTHGRFRVLIERLEELESRVEGLEYLAAHQLLGSAAREPESTSIPDAARIVAAERDRLSPGYAEPS